MNILQLKQDVPKAKLHIEEWMTQIYIYGKTYS